jgi:hypothetical protein
MVKNNINAMSLLRELLTRPWMKTIVIPILVVYFLLRPVLHFLFPATADDGGTRGKSGLVGGLSKRTSQPQSAEDFLRQRLDLLREKQKVSLKSKTQGEMGRRGESSNSDDTIEAPSPAVRSMEAQSFSKETQNLCARLKVSNKDVVTIAISGTMHKRAQGLHELLQLLSGAVPVFVLVRLQTVDKDSSTAHTERAEVEQAFSSLTSGPIPSLPSQRLLFCTNNVGRSAAVRQLRSTLHIDFDRDVCRTLEQHVRSIIFVSMHDEGQAGSSPLGFSSDGLVMVRSFRQLHDLQL